MLIRGFWHIYATDVGRQIAAAQGNRLHESGLFARTQEILAGVVGPRTMLFDGVRSAYHPEAGLFEGWTLGHLYAAAFEPPMIADPDALVWYIHTKGASWGVESSWREALEACVIDDHACCIEALSDPRVGTCGPLVAHNPFPFYAGNFWWARASYIRRLISPHDFGRWFVSRGSELRYSFEAWIARGLEGSSIEEQDAVIKPYSLWNGSPP